MLVAVAAGVIAIFGVVSFFGDIEQFRDPETLTITTDRAVSRDIFTSSASRRVTVVATRLDEGPLPIVSERNSTTTFDLNGTLWSDIGSIDFPGPGQYVVSVTPVGAEIALTPRLSERFVPIGIWGGVAGAAVFAALIVWLITMIRRRRAKRALVPAAVRYGPGQSRADQYGASQYPNQPTSGHQPGAQDPPASPYPAAAPPAISYHKPGKSPAQVQSSRYHKPGQAPHQVGPTPQSPQWPAAPPASAPLPDKPTVDLDQDEQLAGAEPQPDRPTTDLPTMSQRRATVQPKPAPDPFNQHRKTPPRSPIENAPSDDGPISKG